MKESTTVVPIKVTPQLDWILLTWITVALIWWAHKLEAFNKARLEESVELVALVEWVVVEPALPWTRHSTVRVSLIQCTERLTQINYPTSPPATVKITLPKVSNNNQVALKTLPIIESETSNRRQFNRKNLLSIAFQKYRVPPLQCPNQAEPHQEIPQILKQSPFTSSDYIILSQSNLAK